MRFLPALLLLVFLGTVSTVFAQDDTSEFNIRVFAGDDTIPPSTPTLVSATPTSPTQIDLSWTTATDNFSLGGYIIDRAIGTSSTSTIATTTLTTYSDTGLSASTSYTYAVRAFDISGNYSTSSNSITVTTPNFPVVATTSFSSTEQTAARVVVKDVVITPSIKSAEFDITSAFPARFEIRWGRTSSYEIGFIASDILRRNYVTFLTGLEPGTRYQYEIVGYTPSGSSNVVHSGSFKTLDDIDLTVPANVKRFQAWSVGNDVRLRWELPDDNDIAFVRIVRSHIGYPVSPTDGAVIYQGTGRAATDVGVLLRYSPAYYTAFVYDDAGNISSGAIAIAYLDENRTVDVKEREVFNPPLPLLSSTTQKMPDVFDILIKQNSLEYSFGDESVLLDNDQPFLIYLSADNVTSNLKSIIVQMQDPTDQRQSFSFLLRLNKDQSAYEAVVAPLGVVGKSALVLSVYDFRSLRVAEYRTKILFEDINEALANPDLEQEDRKLLWMFLLVVLLLLLLVIWWLVAKDRADEDKEHDTG